MKKAAAAACVSAALCLILLSGCSREAQEQQAVQEQTAQEQTVQTLQTVQDPTQEVQPDGQDTGSAEQTEQQTEAVSPEWFVGSWQCTKVRYDNMELDSSQVSDTPLAFELRQDGTVVIIGTEQANPAAWKFTGNGVVIIDGDWEMRMEKRGDTLVWNDDGMDMIMTRMNG